MKHTSLIRLRLAPLATLLLALCGLLQLLAGPARAADGTSYFPVRVSANGHYLVDASGKPFLLHGDTAWSVIVQLTKEETEEYLDNRHQKGFNAILVNLIEFYYADHPPRNKLGDEPFTKPGEFSAPNEAYFAHADWVLRKAGEKGILVVLNPCYSGAGRDGWAAPIRANGPTKCREFGQFVGQRYKDFPNIIWQAMSDQTPAAGSDLERNWREVLQGIKECDPNHLWSGHFARHSTALDAGALASHMSLDNAYGGNRSYIQTLRAYNRANPKPTFYNEGFYEAHPGTAGTPQMQRAQAYWALLSGATGHLFGSHRVWAFGAGIGNWIGNPKYDWREGIDYQASREMVHVKKLFEGRAWHELVPDQDHMVVTAGYGTLGDDKQPGGDYVTTARTADGSLVMAYVPSTKTGKRTIAVNMARLSGPANARWYNPTSGTFTKINGSPLSNSGSRDFTTPGDNGTGANDWVLVLEAATTPPRRKAAGPLRVHPDNPRYFTDGSGKTVYLTGSHPWNTIQDMGIAQPPPPFDFDAFLDFLEKHGHNFVRLWRFELTEWTGWNEKQAPLRFTAQHPWKRTGPGAALDGLPKFNFAQWDDLHFERLKSRVQAAQRRGIYVSVMLFEGWCLRIKPTSWSGHPMNAANNINGINGDPNADGQGLEVQMLKVPAITELQRAYIRKVVDLVNEFDNVLYEISNESLFLPEILNWQSEMVRYVNEYQARKPKQHPVGMTNLIGGSQKDKTASNDALFASPATWVSPGLTIWGPGDPYSINPPATTGKKVEILDTDHTWNNACMTRTSQQRADHAWVWKSFLRGYNPIYMDPLDLSQPDGVMTYAKDNAYAIVLARPAMGHTRAYAERMDLAAMTPRNEWSSTRYCLANPGSEYLVYLPDGGEVTVDVSAAKGAMAVEWFNPRTAEKRAGEKVAGGAKRQFQAPFKGDAVLHLLAE